MGTHTSKVQEIKRGGQTIVAHKGDTLARPRGPTAEETVIDTHLGVCICAPLKTWKKREARVVVVLRKEGDRTALSSLSTWR